MTEDADRSRRARLIALGRYAPVLVMAVLAAWIQMSGLAGQVSLANLRAHEVELTRTVAGAPLAAFAAYVAIFGVGTSLFLPIGIIMMLTGGLLFGPWVGAAAAACGATVGALIDYGAARFASTHVHGRLVRGRLAEVRAGFGRNAFAYVLMLRLIPLSPFPLVSVAAGLARAPLWPYMAASLVGAVPVSLIYANLGVGLSELFLGAGRPDLSLLRHERVVLSLAALALLALAPVAFRHRGRLRSLVAPRG